MKRTFTRRANFTDAYTIGHNLRPEDRAEVLAAGGVHPAFLLHSYVAQGREVHVSGIEGYTGPEIIWGVDPVPGEPLVGVPWMLSTPVIYDYPVEFAVASRSIWTELHSRFPLLTNFIDARNTRHIRWLEWLGARMVRRIDHFGAQSLPFLEFASIRP